MIEKLVVNIMLILQVQNLILQFVLLVYVLLELIKKLSNLLEIPIYFLNNNDITDITTHLDKLDVERKTNLVLITEVAKQFTEIIEGNLKPEDAANKIISDIEIYLSE